jgi:hypothetical protein
LLRSSKPSHPAAERTRLLPPALSVAIHSLGRNDSQQGVPSSSFEKELRPAFEPSRGWIVAVISESAGGSWIFAGTPGMTCGPTSRWRWSWGLEMQDVVPFLTLAGFDQTNADEDDEKGWHLHEKRTARQSANIHTSRDSRTMSPRKGRPWARAGSTLPSDGPAPRLRAVIPEFNDSA